MARGGGRSEETPAVALALNRVKVNRVIDLDLAQTNQAVHPSGASDLVPLLSGMGKCVAVILLHLLATGNRCIGYIRIKLPLRCLIEVEFVVRKGASESLHRISPFF